MFEITFKFETEADKESFVSSVISSFNSTGKAKSVHANHVERVGNTVIFTKQPDEVINPKPSVVEETDTETGVDVDDLLATAGLMTSVIDETTPSDPTTDAPTVETSETNFETEGGDFGGGGAGGSFDDATDTTSSDSLDRE